MFQFDESKAGRDSSENWTMQGYALSPKLADTDAKYRNVPSAVAEVQKDLHELALKGSEFAIKKIERWIEKYPNTPLLYNYLATAFMNNRQLEKATKINDKAAKRFPDYPLFRINMAVTAIAKGELDKVEAILGKDLELSQFLPNRKIYHVSEMIQFLEIVTYFFIAKGEYDSAENRINIMKEVVEQFHYPTAKLEIYQQMLKESRETPLYKQTVERPEGDYRYFKGIRKPWVQPTTKAPIFKHPQINWLYQYGFDLPEEKLQQILNLPRLSLIADLEHVIDDTMARYEYFLDMYYQEKTHSFIFHALWLLAELKATEALPKVLHILRQDEEWISFWFSDLIVETVPMIVYHLIKPDSFALLTAFLKEPNHYWYPRSVPDSAIFILGYHHPEMRETCITWFEDMFNYFLDHKDDESIADPALIDGFLDNYLQLTDFARAKPFLKKLYDAELFEDGHMDTWVETEAQFLELADSDYVFFNTIENMRDFNKRSLAIGEEDAKRQLAYLEEEKQRVEKELLKSREMLNKMGNLLGKEEAKKAFDKHQVKRNDPCPCGSGRKFKNCHGS